MQGWGAGRCLLVGIPGSLGKGWWRKALRQREPHPQLCTRLHAGPGEGEGELGLRVPSMLPWEGNL